MKNCKRLFFVSLLILSFSCSPLKSIDISIYEHGIRNIYSINPPKGYVLTKYKGEIFKEFHLSYPDSSLIYMTDDYQSGGSVNRDKVSKYGTAVYIEIVSNDTLDLNGQNDIGNYWRELKHHNFVIGYINVPLSKKSEYDKIISNYMKSARTKSKIP